MLQTIGMLIGFAIMCLFYTICEFEGGSELESILIFLSLVIFGVGWSITVRLDDLVRAIQNKDVGGKS